MYIVLEGGVGTGKTTQSKRLAEYMQTLHPEKQVLRTREPGGTEIAEAIRTLVQATVFEEKMDPICEAYLYAAARAQLLRTRIVRVLDDGGIVICDRNFCSSLAYQRAGNNISMEQIREINKVVVQDILPDYIIYLDITAEEGKKRSSDVAGDKHEAKDISYHETVRQGYLTMSTWPVIHDVRRTIDAEGNQDEVFKRILESMGL